MAQPRPNKRDNDAGGQLRSPASPSRQAARTTQTRVLSIPRCAGDRLGATASGKSTATRTQGTVCESAGLSGRIPHDFRRTAVRNLERAGLSRSVAMRMTGHKSEAVYRQYAIVSEQDLHEAALKLARVEQQGKVLGKVAVVRE